MYSLTLTVDERKAIDFVGDRYSNGYDLYRLLFVESQQTPVEDWCFDGPLTFHIPEHTAWAIKENAESEDGFWPLFSNELASKMQALVDSIV